MDEWLLKENENNKGNGSPKKSLKHLKCNCNKMNLQKLNSNSMNEYYIQSKYARQLSK